MNQHTLANAHRVQRPYLGAARLEKGALRGPKVPHSNHCSSRFGPSNYGFAQILPHTTSRKFEPLELAYRNGIPKKILLLQPFVISTIGWSVNQARLHRNQFMRVWNFTSSLTNYLQTLDPSTNSNSLIFGG